MAEPAQAKSRQWAITVADKWSRGTKSKIFLVEAEHREDACEQAEDHNGSEVEFIDVVEIKKLKGVVHEIESEEVRGQEELIAILSNMRPAHFYRVGKDILAEFPELNHFSEEYDESDGSGQAAFIVADHELKKTEKEMIAKRLVAESI
jgi:hypothetical protein